MHGLVNRAIEEFTRSTYGDGMWAGAAAAAGVDPRGFVVMRVNGDATTRTLIAELARRLSRSEGDLAEDIGAWVARIPTIRRLLRFAAPDFAGFMTVLPEMGDRITMVVRGFELPRIRVRAAAHGWCVAIEGDGVWPHVLSGILHAMADDYGVLAVISVRPEGLSVSVPLTDFSEGRPFSLSDPMVGLG